MTHAYLDQPLAEQLVGNVAPCAPYSPTMLAEHRRLVQEADAFAAASIAHPNERYELLAQAHHRYQWIISEAVSHLRLPVWHLKHQKVWFNFYAELVKRFGCGTQAYTTETELPHVGLSEVGLRDADILQLILIHEAQHSHDYAFYDGFNMSLTERELRARLTVCCAVEGASGSLHALRQSAQLDAAYWYVILGLLPSTTDAHRAYYFEQLDEMARRLLYRGLKFSSQFLQIIAPELTREGLVLAPSVPYRVLQEGEHLRILCDDRPLLPGEGLALLDQDGALAAAPSEAIEGWLEEPEEIEAVLASDEEEILLTEMEAVEEFFGGRADPSGDATLFAGDEGNPLHPAAPPDANLESQPEARFTLNGIDDWVNYPRAHKQLTDRLKQVTDQWAQYDIDPSIPLPATRRVANPAYTTHQDLVLRRRTGPLSS